MVTEIKSTLGQSVNANTAVTDEAYVVPDGKRFNFTHRCGSACYSNDVNVEIKFGDEIIFVTHGDKTNEKKRKIIGDGEKEVKIYLNNNSESAETIECEYIGTEY